MSKEVIIHLVNSILVPVGRNVYGACVSPDGLWKEAHLILVQPDQQVASSHYFDITVYFIRLLVLYP